MLQNRQGRNTVSDYAIDFRTLATSTGWNQEAQYDAFLHGLADDVKELITHKLPASLIEVVIHIDRGREQSPNTHSLLSASLLLDSRIQVVSVLMDSGVDGNYT
ncbi:hypothetical protein SKAU_G00209110 [Synaphobranchus kaupii]|uniref:Retrotransposon gag domain-containing protein n=1 Tax=Synaphobranchus kaupii TaxID=118154 RepID=A0A9Q1IUD8_SYNKA|nr:hypothetical protein SKAU_G00209110 [Synaphobranchus kaupii]